MINDAWWVSVARNCRRSDSLVPFRIRGIHGVHGVSKDFRGLMSAGNEIKDNR